MHGFIAKTKRSGVVLMLVAVLPLAGCVNTSVKQVDAAPAEHAEAEIPDSQLLNVNVAVFDPGVPDDPEAHEEADLFPAVRNAEARLMAVNLRNTLQDTGYWGAVRVVPEPIDGSELMVTGEIIDSNGLRLEVTVHAEDATGRLWLDKGYSAEAAAANYEPERGEKEPFQSVYNRIADDLLQARRELAASELQDIRRVSEMRFAADLAPEVFDGYLAREDSRYRLTGLPAEGDPVFERVERIRERDYVVIDALDQHYRVYHDQIDAAYGDWRASSYREAENLRELRRSSLGRKLLGGAAVLGGIFGATQSNAGIGSAASQTAILGGAVLFGSGVQKGKESEIHAQALEELGRSLESDVKPHTVQLANQTVTLSGSAEAQYEEWRRLLRDIYAAETGFAVDSEAAGQTRSDDR